MVCVVSERGEYWKRVIHKGKQTNRLVSTKGKVVDINTGKTLLLSDNGAGYLTAHVQGNQRVYIHRLVASAFIANPDNLPQVNHIDCDKSNNCVENLEWVTGSRNIKDAHEKGRMKKRTENGQINILTKDQVVYLYTRVKKYKEGIAEIARELGIPRTTASSIINKRSRWDITDLLDLEFTNETKTPNTH